MKCDGEYSSCFVLYYFLNKNKIESILWNFFASACKCFRVYNIHSFGNMSKDLECKVNTKHLSENPQV